MAGCSIASIVLIAICSPPASAQIVEAAGSRALGMGGAFVAVADDSSATWWNPAGLATGPFLDMSLARATTEQPNVLPVRRDGASWFALGTPPFGISYYRLRVTDAQPAGTDVEAAFRVRSLPVSQFGITLVHTVFSGIHVGTTVKYVSGTFLSTLEAAEAEDPGPSGQALLRRGDHLGGGRTERRLDADAGVLVVSGPMRLGGVVRNARAPQFGDEVTLPRQVRLGAAFQADQVWSIPLMVSLDADLQAYETGSGDRRVVAVGAEHWLLVRRLGLRAGIRVNTVGAEERAATAGVSYAVRTGMYLDGHVVHGGASGERGWGLAGRVSF